MKLLIYIVVGIVAGLLVLAGIIALIGSRLSKAHVASRSILLHRSAQDVYAVVRDFDSAPKWRSDLKRIEVSSLITMKSDSRLVNNPRKNCLCLSCTSK